MVLVVFFEIGFFNCSVRLEWFFKVCKLFSFSDFSVNVVLLSMFRMVQLTSNG